jgi:hypothetical protein
MTAPVATQATAIVATIGLVAARDAWRISLENIIKVLVP